MALLVAVHQGVLLAAGGRHAGDGFELRDGDRVVLVGNTLIERERRYGHWESVEQFPSAAKQ
jgi:hypothetical protein